MWEVASVGQHQERDRLSARSTLGLCEAARRRAGEIPVSTRCQSPRIRMERAEGGGLPWMLMAGLRFRRATDCRSLFKSHGNRSKRVREDTVTSYYQEYRELRHGQSQLEQRLLKKGYTVEHCDKCNCSALVPVGETWGHQCKEKHQLIWLTVHDAACTGCDWKKERPRVDGRWQSGHTVRAMHRAAHQPK